MLPINLPTFALPEFKKNDSKLKLECFFKKNDFHCWVVTEANGDIKLSPPISNQHHNLNYHHQLSSTRAYHLQFQTSITNLNYHHQLSSTRVRTGGDGPPNTVVMKILE